MISKVKYLNQLKPEVQMLKVLGKELYKSGLLLVGGSIWCAYRGLPINDIDIMSMTGEILTEEQHISILTEAARLLDPKAYCSTDDIQYKSKYASNIQLYVNNVSYKVQFIDPIEGRTRTPTQIVMDFDIMNCSLYISGTGEVVSRSFVGSDRHTHSHILANELYICAVRNVKHTFSRLNKYVERGANYTNDTIQGLLHIQKAFALYNIIEDIPEPFEDGYEAMSIDSQSFTVTQASDYIRTNTQKIRKALGIDVKRSRPNVSSVFNWDALNNIGAISDDPWGATAEGSARYNHTTNSYEIYSNGQWGNISIPLATPIAESRPAFLN